MSILRSSGSSLSCVQDQGSRPFLFAHRAKRLAKTYINTAVIPSLCRKAGVPTADIRGNITSHRARSTIASQLYNAKESMTLFELQAWLGHRSPEATQHYAKITPNTLARAYNDAGYFERNVRTIEVLVDRDAVTSGAAASGDGRDQQGRGVQRVLRVGAFRQPGRHHRQRPRRAGEGGQSSTPCSATA
ncbi:tyrosine-type recombinase/integrase [Streptomyces sp. NBC_01525]